MTERQTKQPAQDPSTAEKNPPRHAPVRDRKDQPSRDPVDSPEKIAPGDREHGEGNYKASREYNDATRQFVKSGRVDEAADQAAPQSDEEAREMEEAEKTGRQHAQGEDPEISQPKKRGSGR